ncbi:hypothetical protein EUBHAL_03175 [Anaerobutyricum hallii DSM 3353]|uniref:Uncharacterized protein n=1 Tax=Anaerobutyricum hallii DSM 3353 TaxID=411469 RepID=C0F0F5_9FIRM|nr:hypothetical protein EUBHAL_03175 [Anaerobutyricum hallii DSM 3353]GFO92773.1 hypothetical protein ANHA31_30800 [Anaerobutyricum hallii]
MFAYALASTLCSEATNIAYCLSLGAVFGCWSKIRIHVGEFGDCLEDYIWERMENGLLKINVIYCYNVKARI